MEGSLMSTRHLPNVWNEPLSDVIPSELRNEAAKRFRIHQLPRTLAEWKKKRPVLIRKIWEKLGVSIDHELDLDVRETGSIRMDGYTIIKLYYRSRPGMYVTANLYVPEGKGPFPAVLNMHGHWAQGRLAERIQQRGHSLAKNGYVCLCVDAFGAGERATEHGTFEYHGGILGASLMNVGETLMGAQIVDNMRGIDLLSSLPYVDSERIGATGASGGGNQTMWVTALDDRIKAAVPVVSVGSFQSYVTASNCICELLPDGLDFMEESAVLALVAPRALKICNCLKDSNPTFFPSEMLRTLPEARHVFRAYGVDSQLAYQIFPYIHGYWPEIREAMLGWFDLHLKGIGHGAPKAEIPFTCLEEWELMVFPQGKRPPEVVTISEYCRKRGAEIRKEMLAGKSIDPNAALRQLAAILRIGPWLRTEAAHEHPQETEWRKLTIRTQCGRMIPVLRREPEKGRKILVLASPVGKADVAGSRLLESALSAGDGVLIFDPWGCGETDSFPDTSRGDKHHTLTRAVLWLGQTLLGEWTRDYAAVAEYATREFPRAQVEIGGLGEAGLAALAASALLPKLGLPVHVERGPLSLALGRRPDPAACTMAAFVPGFLKWGDISLLAALTNRRVVFISPVKLDGATPDKTEIDLAKKEFARIRKMTGMTDASFQVSTVS
jgi:hypothetical protein